MAKGSKRAEELADRLWGTVRPQIIKIIRDELYELDRIGGSDPTDLSDRDLEQAEQVARKWATKSQPRR